MKQEKWEKIGIILRFGLFIFILAGAFFAFRFKDTLTDRKEPVDAYFIKTVGEANATLVKQGSHDILIDTGEEIDSQGIVAFLKEKQVDKIDYLILTHPDKDHIGGAPGILDEFEVDNVIMPYYDKENAELLQLTETIEDLNIPITYPSKLRHFALGSMKLTVYPPLEGHYKRDNNYSLATLINHQEVNFLFAGDSESKRLKELMLVNWPEIDVYLVAHHGRSNPSAQLFIEEIAPKNAVTTASSNDEQVQQALTSIGANTYYSVEETVHFKSDGQGVSINK